MPASPSRRWPISRSFNALWGTTITYKAFYNQVAKSRFADFARTMTSRLIGDMTLKVLGFAKGRAFAEFRHIVLQDGGSFAIHDGLREVFPGRFKVVKPAAVELPTTMDLLCDTPTTVVLTPDTTSEQAFCLSQPHCEPVCSWRIVVISTCTICAASRTRAASLSSGPKRG